MEKFQIESETLLEANTIKNVFHVKAASEQRSTTALSEAVQKNRGSAANLISRREKPFTDSPEDVQKKDKIIRGSHAKWILQKQNAL